MLNAALEYARHGIPVFPLVPRAKHPLTKNGFKDATTDEAKITEWWTVSPEANIGVPTGLVTRRSVVDMDMKPWKGAYGDKTIAGLVLMHGALPATLSQTTWSGGTQYFFAYNPECVNSTHSYGEFIDGRNDGGYVAVPPSHVVDGEREGTYAWHSDPFTTPLAPMPEWLVERGRSGPYTPESEKKPGGVSRDGKRRNPHGWADALVGGVSEGSRDDTATRLIGRYSQLRLSRTEIERFMLAWAAACTPPFDEKIVLEKIDRLFKVMDSGLVDLPTTDAGNAERLVLLHGDRFRWAVDRKTWLAWDGRRWAEGSEDKVRALALDTIRQTQAAAVRLDNDHRKSAIAQHAIRSEDRRRIDNAVALARILPGVAIEDKMLDQHPMLLNVLNGTIDLRTGELRPHDPELYITQVVQVEYHADAKAPTWEKFLNDIFLGKLDVIAYVQRAIGYSVTGSNAQQELFFEHGAGDNGKSTFIEAVASVMGDDYTTPVDKEAVLAADKNKGRGATPELMRLKGKRLGYISENDADRVLDEGRIKSLTGSKKTTGRGLYEATSAFDNTIKIWFDLNTLPKFTGVDKGIERRPKVIPFDFTVPPEHKDSKLPEKLLAEAQGILAWIVAGAVAWNQQGLAVPAEVEYATREYIDEQNHLPAFFGDCYERDPHGVITGGDLQKEYAEWCRNRGEEPYDYQRKVVPFLRDRMKLRENKSKHGKTWIGVVRKLAA
jgi:putative DNA primase/helicase